MIRKAFFTILLMMATASPAWADTFNHRDHLQEYIPGEPCDTCHKPEAPTIVPDKSVCLQCHEQDFIKEVKLPATRTHGPVWPLNHREEAKEKAIDCAACHQQQFCLECHIEGYADEMGQFGNKMINVHMGDYFVTHPIPARTNPQLCSTCHENAFCVDCHEQFRRDQLAGVSHRRSWSDLKVGTVPHSQFSTSQCQSCHPNSVLPAHDWEIGHAREARKNLVTCQACHPEGDVCLKCHSARSGLMVNPHPADWGDIKDRLNGASNGRTCRKCH
ncbi:MAG: cytochrome C [Deltaproteobacteria bacterium]